MSDVPFKAGDWVVEGGREMSDRQANSYVQLGEYTADGYVCVYVLGGLAAVDGHFTSAQLREIADKIDKLLAEARPTPTLRGFPVKTVKDDPILKDLGKPIFGEPPQ